MSRAILGAERERVKVEIREVRNRSDRKVWVRFPLDHYAGDAHYVPQLLADEIAYFDPAKNPVYEVAQVRLFLAQSGARVLGRICGIINRLEEEKLGRKVVRFGWFESIDDQDVADRLLEAVSDWGRLEGCVEMTGPHGFSDLDPGGILVEGFDQTPTIAGSHNPPYYATLMERHGLAKDVDYVEFRVDITEPVPFLERLRGRVENAGGYTVRASGSRKELLARADEIWAILERAFEHLSGVVPLTEAQTEFYSKKYLSFLDPEFVKLSLDATGRMVGFCIGMPNLSGAFRKAAGRLLPTGWFHVLREHRKPHTVDLLLAGVLPEEPSSMMTTMGLIRMCDSLRERGIRYLETNRELETNTTVNRIWRRFDIIGSRKTRIYRMLLESPGQAQASQVQPD